MEPEASFGDLLRRVRAGDAPAAAELVRQFEPEVRRHVRLRLSNPRFSRLQRVLDSVDISQSVLGNFFVRAALGQFDLETPRDLIGLLVTMAQNKLIDQARKRANRRPLLSGAVPRETVVAPGDSPSQIVAGAELIQEFLRRMSPAERRIAELRAAHLGWGEIAAQVGGTGEGVRKQLERAIRRVERQLGLEGDSDA
ncbi:MAG TPA: sigma-70 family RNA polymerase sigma factor [Gemmataceae bacterium]|nr:sigma-70 family RNA polymerase sigma factor [Gemmataceae bacterium]